MARPRIGIFGALFAVGSVLAWKWVQSQDASKRRAARDLNRWEDERAARWRRPRARRRSRPPTPPMQERQRSDRRDARSLGIFPAAEACFDIAASAVVQRFIAVFQKTNARPWACVSSR